MPHENTPEYAKALYDFASLVERSQDLVYAAQLLEKLARLRDPYYTAFALSQLQRVYTNLGRDDLVRGAIRRILELPPGEQELLNPNWLASCYQRTQNFAKAREILRRVEELAPGQPNAAGALGEMALEEGLLQEAHRYSDLLSNRPEPAFQLIGKLIAAIAFSAEGQEDEALRQVMWVAQYLTATGSVPQTTWDFHDLRRLAAKAPVRVRASLDIILNVMTGITPIPEIPAAIGGSAP